MPRAPRPLPEGPDASHVAGQAWGELHPELQTHFKNQNAFRQWKSRQTGSRAAQAGATKLSITFLVPALSNAICSLLPSTASTCP